MKAIFRIFSSLNFLTKQIGVCGNVGLIAGAVSGFILTILDLMYGGLVLTNREAVYVFLLFGMFVWLIILFILCMLIRFTFRSVALPSFLNCFITCFAVVFFIKQLRAYTAAWLIGIVAGIFIGMLLCRISTLFKNQKQ